MATCHLCPRRCGVDRENGERGFCGQLADLRVARAALHAFEEPPISGTRGSGTIFFSGCSLRCVFCQNREISRAEIGKTVSVQELAEIMLSLQDEGAHNVNLVTPTHFSDRIAQALTLAKKDLHVPVVYNSSGYETVEALQHLEGLVDVYLPDFKYADSALAARYSAAPDYPEVAERAIAEMYRQTGEVVLDENGLAQRGVFVRLLVLPGHRHDAIAVLRRLAALLPIPDVRLSLMSQYTPEFAFDAPDPVLHRRLTRFEYESVLKEANALGFDGYMQAPSSANRSYTPNFSENIPCHKE